MRARLTEIFAIQCAAPFSALGYAIPASQIPLEAWQSLNQSVSGKLGVGRPLALPCYQHYSGGPGSNNFSSERNAFDGGICDDIKNNKNDPVFIGDRFGGYMTYNFAGCVKTAQQCALSAILPAAIASPSSDAVCSQGCVPSYYVDVRTYQDAQVALKFANEQNVRLVVKNTGHDYRGRSSAPDSFAIWTHNIKPPMRVDQEFVPEGCSNSTGPSFTYGSGEQFYTLNDFIYKEGYFLVGGAAPTVGGGGGWVLGGGHSFASNTLGLGVDNVVQMRVVLPNGTYVTANRCQNQDIFFAQRGGGGGTFGVLMETTSKVHPIQPFQHMSMTALSFAGDKGKKVMQTMIDSAAQWAEDGWGGYIGPNFAQGYAIEVSLVTPKLTLEQAQQSMKPLLDLANDWGTGVQSLGTSVSTLNSGYHDYMNTTFVQAFNLVNNVGLALASRLIPNNFFAEPADKQTLLDTLVSITEGGQPNPVAPIFILLVPPTSYKLPDTDIPPYGPGAASVTPSWRNSTWDIYAQAVWDPTDESATLAGNVTQAFRNDAQVIDKLRKLAPHSGAYQNEADPWEPDWIGSFWGQDNYDRLLQIKQDIDPNNIMTCLRCVGYDAADPRYQCYPDI